MKNPLRIVISGMAVIAMSISLQAQASWPTPVDTNANGKIDSAEIQDVIDTITTGIVFLPSGKTYEITTPITISKDGIILLGEGHGTSTSGGTIFKITADIEGIVVANCSNSGVRDMSISAPTLHTANVIRLTGTTGTELSNLRITGAYNGIEIVDCVSPSVKDVSMRGHVGPYGYKIWGNTGTTTNVSLTRIGGGGNTGNVTTEWIIAGPNVDGLNIRAARLIGCLRGMRLTGSPGPTNITTVLYGTDNQTGESLVAESGSGLHMTNSWIGQPDQTAVVLEAGFSGSADFINLRIRGAYFHGMEIIGGDSINLWNPLIGANGASPSAPSSTIAGVRIADGVTNVRVVGGRVGPMYGQGGGAKQYYGVHYLGTTTDSDSDDVKTRGVSLLGNAVPFTPANLPINY